MTFDLDPMTLIYESDFDILKIVPDHQQVAQLSLTDRATIYVRRVHCAVVSTASGSVQGETQSYSPGKNNATEAPSAECI